MCEGMQEAESMGQIVSGFGINLFTDAWKSVIAFIYQ